MKKSRAHDDSADLLRICKFAGRINLNILRADFKLAAGQRDIAGTQNVLQIGRRHAILRQPLLRVIQVDLLWQHSLAINLGNFRGALQGSSNQVGVVVQLPVGIFISRDRSQASFGICRITDECCGPGIRMDFIAVKLLHEQAVAQRPQLIVGQLGTHVGADKATAGK